LGVVRGDGGGNWEERVLICAVGEIVKSIIVISIIYSKIMNLLREDVCDVASL
jgi:hypothetical protein